MGKLADRRPDDADDLRPWKTQESLETYGLKNWGKGYFGVNRAGHVTVHPTKDPNLSIDLKELVDQLIDRDVQVPVLLRFTDIRRHRVGEIADVFQRAIRE